MGLAEDLTSEVVKTLKEQWTTRDGSVVPETDDLKLANDAVKLRGTVLYADLADSTGLVMARTPTFAAEVYKCYLSAASRIIRARGGEITAFDGDRVMAVFLGDSKNRNAVRAGLNIKYAVQKIITPRIREQYPKLSDFKLQQSVGIDTSDLFVARTGIRGANDLVWVGRAANYAAKLCALRDEPYETWITGEVYDDLSSNEKVGSNGASMWEERVWTQRDKLRIFRSSWTWEP